MSNEARHILDEAMRLSLDERADLARELIASLDGPPDADAEDAWATTIARRASELKDGRVKAVPWAEAEARILKRLATIRPR